MRRRKIDRTTVSHEAPASRPQPVGAHPTPVGHPRYFIALLPDAQAAEALARLAATIAADTGGRPLVAEDIHLTLAFIGARDASFGERLERAIAPVEAAATLESLLLTRLGRFGRSHRPALFWAGPDAPPAWLDALAAQVRQALRAMPCEFDERPLVPHLSLVRNARPEAIPAALLETPIRITAWRLAMGHNRPDGGPLRYIWNEPADRHETVKGLS